MTVIQVSALLFLGSWGLMAYGYFSRNAKAIPTFMCYMDAVVMGLALTVLITILTTLVGFLIAIISGVLF